MLVNLTAIAIGVIVMWVVILAIYLRSSRQQQLLQEDLDALARRLDALEHASEGEDE